ncbi:PhzF family phenazine biosynthesis protein [Evansella halocellulosilytica]|uniref:PhzF family phenazine biosynthesis protein n=1 Tax=Evansella halocellulosilytica TaxID=2011013 RepID=UPI000BB825A3|nr:PhzF family phenazine biosynthesis protein [Evansella halocellulosilytica]
MSVYIYFVNAFTNKAFKGNPAAIVFLQNEHSESWMSSVAAEMNQSITTFLLKHNGNPYQIRWFTPEKEIPLCGHGTLGAAHILWNEFNETSERISFQSNTSELYAEKKGKKIQLTFPKIDSTMVETPNQLNEILGCSIQSCSWASDRYIVEVESEEVIHCIAPNFEKMRELDGTGVIVTSRGTGSYDFVSRYFAPKIGIKEDYVTGSAHCSLAPYWSSRLHKTEFTAYQDSERGGEVSIQLTQDHVQLSGDCITVLKGNLVI